MRRIAFAVFGLASIGLFGIHALAQEAPTILGVSLANVPSTLTPRDLPDLRRPHPQIAGKSEPADGVLVMPIYDSQPDATLHYPCRQGHFYIALRADNNRLRYFGPIDGDPFQRLNLETSLRMRLRSAEDDSNDALLRLRQLIARGDGRLRALGFSMVNELPVPKDRHLLGNLEDALRDALPEVRDATIRDLGEEALAHVTELTAIAVQEWNARRVLLPDEEYQAGNSGEAPARIRWGAVDESSGLQVGFGLASSLSGDLVDLSSVPWVLGETKLLTVWVRQHGNQTTKFTSSNRADEGLDVWFVDSAGKQNTREQVYFSGALIPKRHQLSQGQWLRLKTLRLKPGELAVGTEKRPYGGQFVEPGAHALRVQLRIAGFESTNAAGAVTVPAQGEWTGTLTVIGGTLQVGAADD